MKQKCIIVGAGTYGQVYLKYLEEDYDVVGFIDDDASLVGSTIYGVGILGDFEYLLSMVDKSIHIFVPIGNNKVRVNLLSSLIKHGFITPCFVHKSCLLDSSVELGKAIYILPNTNIMPFTKISDFTLISMGVNIAHHSIINKGCFFSQGSNIGASITFEENVFCGISSTVMTGVKRVGENALIGAGAVIIRSVPNGATVVGNPGKVIKTTSPKH